MYTNLETKLETAGGRGWLEDAQCSIATLKSAGWGKAVIAGVAPPSCSNRAVEFFDAEQARHDWTRLRSPATRFCQRQLIYRSSFALPEAWSCDMLHNSSASLKLLYDVVRYKLDTDHRFCFLFLAVVTAAAGQRRDLRLSSATTRTASTTREGSASRATRSELTSAGFFFLSAARLVE